MDNRLIKLGWGHISVTNSCDLDNQTWLTGLNIFNHHLLFIHNDDMPMSIYEWLGFKAILPNSVVIFMNVWKIYTFKTLK